ncbi:MAG: response regulator transcription factor [Lachnospiraceae bacterium]|nr:response regulator transcription factor [Lachnospiraceae bacterium]
MKIVLIDDDQLVCMSLKIILESDASIEVSAVGNDGSEALPLYRQHKPDVLLMDIRMQNMDGTDALFLLLREFPDARVLLLTTFLDDEYIVKALELGAKGYIVKQNFENIIPALEAVNSGQNVYGDEIIQRIPNLIKTADTFDYTALNITQKEYEIITLVAEGLNNKEIADQLYLSEGTTRNYLSTILEKLALRDRTQLAIFYYQHK